MEAHSAGRRARARAIGWLIAAGAAMVLVWIALPHPDRADDAVVVALVVVTWLLAAGLLAGRFDGASLTSDHRGADPVRGRDQRHDPGDGRPGERVRAVLRLSRAVRVRRRIAAPRGGARDRDRRPLRRRAGAPGARRARRGGRRRAGRPLARRRHRQHRARPLRAPHRHAPAPQRGPLPARLRALAGGDGDPQPGLALARGQRRAVPDARLAAARSSSATRPAR